MKLREPRLRKRVDRSLPYSNKVLGDVEKIFMVKNSCCIHFCETNNSYSVIKLLLSDAPIEEDIDSETVSRALKNMFPGEEYLKEYSYFARFNIHYQIVIIFDEVDWRKENNKLLVVDFHASKQGATCVMSTSIWNQKDYQAELVKKYGINRTNKPLIYATTEFEGYLSDISTPSCSRDDITLFPGDVDLITFDDDLSTLNIFEFKKHTKFGYGSLEYQSFLKYYRQDYKKYNGIANLTRALNKEYFYNIIYSTRDNELNLLKIEKIDVNLQLLEQKVIRFADIKDLKMQLSLIIT